MRGAAAPFSDTAALLLIDRLAAAYGWAPAEIAALPLSTAQGLLTEQDARRRSELADLALAVYAGTAGALGGPRAYRALTQWVETMRAPRSTAVTPFAEAGIDLE